MCCPMIITIRLTHPSPHKVSNLCVCWGAVHPLQEMLSSTLQQFSNIPFSIVNYSGHAVNYMPRIYSSSKWKFVCFDHFHHFPQATLPTLHL